MNFFESLFNDEQKLTEAVANGNESAFKFIYDKYYPVLCLYANRFVNNIPVAEDVVQDCIFNLWEQRSNLKKVANIKAYLYKSVHNRCINYINHQKVQGKYKSETEFRLKKIELETSDTLITKELEEKINEAINNLPFKCKICFKMKRLEGLSQKAIAKKLDISEKAVEANISRALSQLRKKLNEYLVFSSLISLIISIKSFFI